MNKLSTKTILACSHLTKTFEDGKTKLTVLKDICFSINENETVAVLGRSGSGKSSFLHLLGGLDRQTSGEIYWAGQAISRLSESTLSRLRNEKLGFIYQFHHLLPEFSALENVALPLLIAGKNLNFSQACAETLLNNMGLKHRLGHRLGELSGGERQRVAIARALIRSPICLLADEPTGSLDQYTTQMVFELLLAFNKTMIMVTHDESLAKKMSRVVVLESGTLK